MANITIKELLAADNISELVDKINFNFDQLLLNGGGPLGPTGPTGGLGPIGPRGSSWFSAIDIHTTVDSPSWTGTEERVNTINAAPITSGDPNKYLPVGNGTYPENTYQIGNTNKQLRQGDLYVQELLDNLNGYSSSDGDIWEYNGTEWFFTGVNIKGETGDQGSAAGTEWERISNNLVDYLYPRQETGQDIPKITIGVDPSNVLNETADTPLSIIGSGGNITLLSKNLHTGDASRGSTISQDDTGILRIYGSGIKSSTNGSKEIIIKTFDDNIVLDTNDTSTTGPKYTLSKDDSQHQFTGAPILASASNTAVHKFESTGGGEITIAVTASGTANTIGTNDNLIIEPGSNLGIGAVTAPANKLTVAGSASIGSAYNTTSAPGNSLIVQNKIGIATKNPGSDLEIGTNKSGTNFTTEIKLISKSSTSIGGLNTSKIFSNKDRLEISHTGTSTSIIEINPISSPSPTSGAYVDVFKDSSSLNVKFRVFKGDGSNTKVHELSGRDANSYIANNGGNVGVGTDSPSQAKLDVNGKLRVRTVDSTTSDFQLLSIDNDGVVHKRSASNIVSATGNGVPCGVIAMWSGSVNDIPAGWLLCDGSQGTPDLRGRFIAGYKPGDGEYSPIGHLQGENRVTLTPAETAIRSHTHPIAQGYTGSNYTQGSNEGSHDHQFQVQASREGNEYTGNKIRRTEGGNNDGEAQSFEFTTTSEGAHKHTIAAHSTQPPATANGTPHENRPAYYVLAFIIKDGNCLNSSTASAGGTAAAQEFTGNAAAANAADGGIAGNTGLNTNGPASNAGAINEFQDNQSG